MLLLLVFLSSISPCHISNQYSSQTQVCVHHSEVRPDCHTQLPTHWAASRVLQSHAHPEQPWEGYPYLRFRPGPLSPGRLGHRHPGRRKPFFGVERRELSYLAKDPCFIPLAFLDTWLRAPFCFIGTRRPGSSRALSSLTLVSAETRRILGEAGQRQGPGLAVRGADLSSWAGLGLDGARGVVDSASTKSSG